MKNYITFSEALEKLKQGHRACRKHWKGKGNFIFLEFGCVSKENKYKEIQGIHKSMFEVYQGDICTRMPIITFRDTRGSLNCWNPTHADLLSKDWEISDL